MSTVQYFFHIYWTYVKKGENITWTLSVDNAATWAYCKIPSDILEVRIRKEEGEKLSCVAVEAFIGQPGIKPRLYHSLPTLARLAFSDSDLETSWQGFQGDIPY